MSSLKYSPRKRPYYSGSCDESSDSESEVTPVKLRRLNGEACSDDVSVLQKLKKVFNWVRELPVKEFFTSAIKMGTKANIIYVEEEDPCTTNQIDTGCKPKKKVKSGDRRSSGRPKYRFKDNFVTLNSTYSGKSFIEKRESSGDSESSSHQTKGRNPFEIKPSSSVCSSSWKFQNLSTLDMRKLSIPPRDSIKKIMKSKKMDALKEQIDLPFVECSNDVEIIFDSRNGKPASEVDDIEIVSEITSPKANSSDFLQSRKELSSCSKNNFKNHMAASLNTKSYAKSKLNAFTAHDVIRLQEKDQYQLLLEKYVSRPLYQPIVKKSFINFNNEKTSKKKEPCRSAFSKETLTQPIAPFLEKYKKPCQLVQPTTSDKSPKKELCNVIDVDDEEDNVFVLPSKLPTVRPPPRKCDYFSPEWIAELKISVNEETEERMKIVKEQEEELEKYRKRRAGLNAQEKQKMDSLMIKGIVLPESGFDKDADFIELTPEMEEVIDYAFQADYSQVLSTKDGITIMRKDIETLSGSNWLNDEVINYYLALIVERGMLDNYPSVHSFNSFFYVTLKSRGFSAIRRWTRKIDIFTFDINLVPLHLGLHWCLAVIDHRYKTIRYYDSMGSGEDQCLERLRDYLVQEKKDKKNEIMDRNSYTIEIMKDIPGQMNGCDCGMFTLKYAEYISRDADITFTQLNMQHFRRRMVYEILKSQLL